MKYPSISNIVERALAGEKIPLQDLRPLFELEAQSAEAAHIRWAAETVGRRASSNTGQIYAQIGVDALPCPANCDFCSFAAKVSHGVTKDAIVPTEDIVRYARIFDNAGVHLISLMATAGLPFERYLDIVQAVRAAISDDMPILANAGDLTFEQACALKDAGAQGAYHAHRIGEGSITQLDPRTRIATMENINNAGLKLMNAVEPIREGISAEKIIEHMEEAARFRPYCSGVGTLTVVPGTALASAKPISRLRAAFVAALFRLYVGDTIPFGTGSRNVVWADAGTNPRGRQLPIDAEHLERDVKRCRKELIGREWDVPARPLPSWF